MGVKVREKPKGSGDWWVFISHQGKRKAKKIGRNKKLANEVAARIEAKLVLGQLELDEEENEQQPFFRDYAEEWLESFIKPLRRSSTHERYKDILTRYVYPQLGKTRIDEIKRGDIRNLILKYNKKGVSRSLICLIRDVISGPMGYAVDEEIIPANPVSGILKRLKLERNKKCAVIPLTQEETELFLTTCQQFFEEHYTFFLCAFRTGLRLGELLALEWGDIDWKGKYIHVQRTYRRGVVNPPKNGDTRRVDIYGHLIPSSNRDAVNRLDSPQPSATYTQPTK